MHLTIPSFPKLALLLSVFGLLAAWGGSFLVTPTYVSQAALQLSQKPGSRPADLRRDLGAMQQEILSRTSLKFIIENVRLDLYPNERRRQPLEDVIETMRTKDLKIALIGSGPTSAAFTISFSYSDPAKAHDTVQAIIKAFQEANLEHQRSPALVNRPRTYDQVDRMEARIAVLEKRLGIPPTPPESLDQFVPRSEGTNLDVLDPPSTARQTLQTQPRPLRLLGLRLRLHRRPDRRDLPASRRAPRFPSRPSPHSNHDTLPDDS